MNRFSIQRQIQSLLLLATIASLAGCFKNAGNEKSPTFNATINVNPLYAAATTSSLVGSGGCMGMSGVWFTYSSALNSSRTIEGICKNDRLTLNMPLDYGDQIQVFTVIMAGHVGNKRTAPVTITVNYTPTVPSAPGFAVLSGGGFQSGLGMSVNASIGEIVSPATTSGTGTLVRTGVQGVLNP